MRTTLTPQRDDGGRVVRLIATAMDISTQNSMIDMAAEAEKLGGKA